MRGFSVLVNLREFSVSIKMRGFSVSVKLKCVPVSHLGSTWAVECVAEAWCWPSHTCAHEWPPVSVSWDGVKKVEDIITHNLSYGVNGFAVS